MNDNKEQTKETIKYFCWNIAEAKLAYETWKMIVCARDSGLVGDTLSKKYTDIQTVYPLFFRSIEHSSCNSFIVLLFHTFDCKNISLYKIDETAMDKFYKQNKKILENLKTWRHEICAHKNSRFSKIYPLIEVKELDIFFENLQDFYNELTRKKEDSTTLFNKGLDIRHEIEFFYQNTDRIVDIRKNKTNIEFNWGKNENLISKKLGRIEND